MFLPCFLLGRFASADSRPRGAVARAHWVAFTDATPCWRFGRLAPPGGAGLIRAVYAASDAGALPAGVGSMSLPGFSGGLPGLSISFPERTGGGSPMSGRHSRGFGVAAGLDPEVAGPLAERCAEFGYGSMWSNDHPGAKGLDTLAEFGAAAPGLGLGVAVIALDRTPPETIAADIKRLGLDPSRLWLGVGAGFSEKPLTRMRESLPELREQPPRVRLVLAAMGPKMCALAGAEFDGD